MRSTVKCLLAPFRVWKSKRLFRALARVRFVLDYWRVIGRLFECQPRNAYAYVVGSDSIWMYENARAFLIDRMYDGRKIAYAVSSAWDNASQCSWWATFMRKVDDTYYAVSAREEVGRKICQPCMPHQRVECVLDPTMLLSKSDYLTLVSEVKYFSEPVLLCYVVNIWSSTALPLELLESTAHSLGCRLKIIGIQGAEDYVPIKYFIHPSPLDFLRAIRDASYVVTNSFHGLAFSIIFRKQFAFLTQLSRVYGNQNCRQDEVLIKMNLINRRIASNRLEANSLLDVLQTPLNLLALDNRISEARALSLHWLEGALS